MSNILAQLLFSGSAHTMLEGDAVPDASWSQVATRIPTDEEVIDSIGLCFLMVLLLARELRIYRQVAGSIDYANS
jgi:hypothetical protein